MKQNTCMRVLIVDDYRDAADTLASLIKELGNEVQVSYSGRLGFQAAQSFFPHLVFLDLFMPDTDGFHFAKQIREDAILSKTNIVAITGYKDEKHKRLALSLGCDFVLFKPAGLAEIECVLDSVARSSGLTNQFVDAN